VNRITLLLCLITALVSCNKDDTSIDENNLLLGSWINPQYENNKTTFKRAKSLKEDGYGISFLAKDVFIERHSGWCGTPPLIFDDFTGLWNKNQNKLSININNGIGTVERKWKIILLDNETLVIEWQN